MKVRGKKVMGPKMGRQWSWEKYAEKWPSSKPEGKVLIFSLNILNNYNKKLIKFNKQGVKNIELKSVLLLTESKN